MRILVSHPGRHGDIIWALPTVRAIARWAGGPVDFVTSKKYGRICDLLNEQRDYISYAWGDPAWEVVESAPISPRIPPLPIKYLEPGTGPLPPQKHELMYDKIIHLGYEGWPTLPLAEEVLRLAAKTVGSEIGKFWDLEEPWITVKAEKPQGTTVVALGWSEEWIELKMGISLALGQRFRYEGDGRGGWPVSFHQVCYPKGRHAEWFKIFPNHMGYHATESWLLRAQILSECKVFVGCLSGLWVLANALGMRTVIAEPEKMRHHKVFWRDSPRNTLVLGTDGLPTADARHVGDVLATTLALEGLGMV